MIDKIGNDARKVWVVKGVREREKGEKERGRGIAQNGKGKWSMNGR